MEVGCPLCRETFPAKAVTAHALESHVGSATSDAWACGEASCRFKAAELSEMGFHAMSQGHRARLVTKAECRAAAALVVLADMQERLFADTRDYALRPASQAPLPLPAGPFANPSIYTLRDSPKIESKTREVVTQSFVQDTPFATLRDEDFEVVSESGLEAAGDYYPEMGEFSHSTPPSESPVPETAARDAEPIAIAEKEEAEGPEDLALGPYPVHQEFVHRASVAPAAIAPPPAQRAPSRTRSWPGTSAYNPDTAEKMREESVMLEQLLLRSWTRLGGYEPDRVADIREAHKEPPLLAVAFLSVEAALSIVIPSFPKKITVPDDWKATESTPMFECLRELPAACFLVSTTSEAARMDLFGGRVTDSLGIGPQKHWRKYFYKLERDGAFSCSSHRIPPPEWDYELIVSAKSCQGGKVERLIVKVTNARAGLEPASVCIVQARWVDGHDPQPLIRPRRSCHRASYVKKLVEATRSQPPAVVANSVVGADFKVIRRAIIAKRSAMANAGQSVGPAYAKKAHQT